MNFPKFSRSEKLGVAGVLVYGGLAIAQINFDDNREHRLKEGQHKVHEAVTRVLTQQEILGDPSALCKTEGNFVINSTTLAEKVLQIPSRFEFNPTCEIVKTAPGRSYGVNGELSYSFPPPGITTNEAKLEYFTPIKPYEQLVEYRAFRQLPEMKPSGMKAKIADFYSSNKLWLASCVLLVASAAYAFNAGLKRTKKEGDEAADLEKLTDLQKETFRIDAGPSRRDAVNQSNVEAAKIFLLKLKSGNNPRFIQYYRAIEAKLKAEKNYGKHIGNFDEIFAGLSDEELAQLLDELDQHEAEYEVADVHADDEMAVGQIR